MTPERAVVALVFWLCSGSWVPAVEGCFARTWWNRWIWWAAALIAADAIVLLAVVIP